MHYPPRSRFTLIELMVAAAIFAIAILGLMVTINTLQIMKRSTKEILIATTAAHDKMEYLRSLSIPDAIQCINIINDPDFAEDRADGLPVIIPTSFGAISPTPSLEIQRHVRELVTLHGGGLQAVGKLGLNMFEYRYFIDETRVYENPLSNPKIPFAPPYLQLTDAQFPALTAYNNYVNTTFLPCDLDLDPDTTLTETQAQYPEYRFLPVLVSVTWKSYYGTRTLGLVEPCNYQSIQFRTTIAPELLE